MPTYNRENCKQELERNIIDKIKGLFHDLKKAIELKNDETKYIEHNLHQADQAIKKLSEMRTIFRNLQTKISTMKKLPERKKKEMEAQINDTFVHNFYIFLS